MYPYEIEATRAHVKALAKAGLLSGEEAQKILAGLEKISKLYSSPDYEEEDVHSFVQEALREVVGSLADKVHTARSRNDLVAGDSILMLRDWYGGVYDALSRLQDALVEKAKDLKGKIIPSYTHLQGAQVVYFSHYLLSYAFAIERIKELCTFFRSGLSSPFTACAGAGTSLPVSAEDIAGELGLSRIYENSMDAIANRDYFLDALYVMGRVGLILSRMAEDWIMYSSNEFGFLRIPEEFSTGSSIMPHKRNPDSMELMRARSVELMLGLTRLLTILKALPMTYNRDMQEDKEVFFSLSALLFQMLGVCTSVIKGLELVEERLSALLENDYLYATDIMEVLIKMGLDSRRAHMAVGRLVRRAEKEGIRLRDLPMDLVRKELLVDIEEGVYRSLFDPVRSVESKTSYNGTAWGNVERQIRLLEGRR